MTKKEELNADDKALEKLNTLFSDVLPALRAELAYRQVGVKPASALEHQISQMHQQLENKRPSIEQMRDNVRLKLERIIKRGKKQ